MDEKSAKTKKSLPGSFTLEFDMQFLLFAELCIAGAASKDLFSDIFENVETVKDIDDEPERELDNMQIAAVMDVILRRFSDGDHNWHLAVLDSMHDMFRSKNTQVKRLKI